MISYVIEQFVGHELVKFSLRPVPLEILNGRIFVSKKNSWGHTIQLLVAALCFLLNL